MDFLDRLLGHDAWTTGELIRRSEELTEEQLEREFDVGLETVRKTLEHIVRNMEAWTDLVNERPIRAVAGSLRERLDRAATDLAATARGIADRNAWDERWLDALDDPPGRRPTAARSPTSSPTACTTGRRRCTCCGNSGSKTCRRATS